MAPPAHVRCGPCASFLLPLTARLVAHAKKRNQTRLFEGKRPLHLKFMLTVVHLYSRAVHSYCRADGEFRFIARRLIDAGEVLVALQQSIVPVASTEE
jgi:hypothetical protein